MYHEWRPYVSVAERRRQAAKEMQKLSKKGYCVSPVVLTGKTIANTFWGKSWCTNLEEYCDYENRLPRGRTYVRNGSVVDLQIAPGHVTAIVSGSSLYKVKVSVSPIPKPHWETLCRDCAGGIDSLVELLQGRFSQGVMERICQQKTGLFPSLKDISLSCSCPDWASMCKHVAAVLYGIGTRLDEQPELLFKLRMVNEQDLIAKASAGIPLVKKRTSSKKVLAGNDLSALFGLDMAIGGEPAVEILPEKPKAKASKTALTKPEKESVPRRPEKKKAVKAATKAKSQSAKRATKAVKNPSAAVKTKPVPTKGAAKPKTSAKSKISLAGKVASRREQSLS